MNEFFYQVGDVPLRSQGSEHKGDMITVPEMALGATANSFHLSIIVLSPFLADESSITSGPLEQKELGTDTLGNAFIRTEEGFGC